MFYSAQRQRQCKGTASVFECRWEVEGWAGLGISLRSSASTQALLKECGNGPRPSQALSVLNKCFVSVP